MEEFILPLIIIIGIGVVIFIIFLLRSIISPKKIGQLLTLLNQRKTQALIKAAKQIIAKESRNADAHYFLGLAYLAEDKYELGLMEFKIVNQISDFSGFAKEVPFRMKMAELFERFEQPEEALKEYLLLIKRDPNNANYYFHVGQLFEGRDRSDKAANYYRKAIQLDPKHGNSHLALGTLLYRGKRPVEAKTELELAIKFNPDNFGTYYYLGKLQKDNHEYVAALVAFEKAQKSPDHKIKALVERGGCYMSMNNYDRASSELERAIKLAENPASNEVLYARYFLSVCYEETRQIEKAIEQWEKIYQKKPNFKDIAEKLSNYQDLRQDDLIKDFLTAGQEEFIEICKQAVVAMSLAVNDINDAPGGCEIIAVESQSKWRNQRRMPKLLKFMRIAEMIDESTVRSFHEKMKKLNITRGIILSSSSFSRLAQNFAETRPIDLFGKEQLQEILRRAGNQ